VRADLGVILGAYGHSRPMRARPGMDAARAR
jgi:hypothetical protein